MKVGDLVHFRFAGKKHIGLIESVDPRPPVGLERLWTEEDYYWVVVPATGERKWIKGIKLEVINESN